MISRLKAVLVLFSALSLFILTVSLYGTFTYPDSYSKFIYKACSLVCHQERELCIKLLGNPMPVCSRCVGLYLGALLTNLFILTFFIKRLNYRSIISKSGIVCITTALSWGLVFADSRLTDLRMISVSHLRRFATGLIAGSSSSIFILFLLAIFYSMQIDQKKA
jgi:uncharacterized membrane protein